MHVSGLGARSRTTEVVQTDRCANGSRLLTTAVVVFSAGDRFGAIGAAWIQAHFDGVHGAGGTSKMLCDEASVLLCISNFSGPGKAEFQPNKQQTAAVHHAHRL